MKKTIATLLTMVATICFAEEPSVTKTLSDVTLDTKALTKETSPVKRGFTYFRIAAADSYPTAALNVVPGIGMGYRLTAGHGALDFSANFSSGEGWGTERKSLFWTLPQIAYLYYLNPTSSQTLYGGIGLSWGGLKTKDDRAFQGIISKATLGMEFFRNAAVRTFAELNVNQPVLAHTIVGAFPSFLADFSIGMGF
jgi:hypothetical protein